MLLGATACMCRRTRGGYGDGYGEKTQPIAKSFGLRTLDIIYIYSSMPYPACR